jgi:hypothetical protein
MIDPMGITVPESNISFVGVGVGVLVVVFVGLGV